MRYNEQNEKQPWCYLANEKDIVELGRPWDYCSVTAHGIDTCESKQYTLPPDFFACLISIFFYKICRKEKLQMQKKAENNFWKTNMQKRMQNFRYRKWRF